MATQRFHLLALPIAVVSIALAACGGSDSPSDSGPTEADFREAALKHARCMREHGIDVPDPKFGPGGRVQMEVRGRPADKQAFGRAEEACGKYLEAVRPPELSPEQQREFREQALKHARCMREHGIEMPDPTVGEGGVAMRLPEGLGPESPGFDEAERACSKHQPKRGVTIGGGK
jgi:hypothetical protein